MHLHIYGWSKQSVLNEQASQDSRTALFEMYLSPICFTVLEIEKENMMFFIDWFVLMDTDGLFSDANDCRP